jgi:formylglycine-generating enzyme required for sulfatase activity
LLAILCAGCSYPEFAFGPSASDSGAADSAIDSALDVTIDDTFVELDSGGAVDTSAPDTFDAAIDMGPPGRCTPIGCAPCPTDMIEMPGLDAKHTFCVDKTEVTRTRYAAFLAKSPSTSGQPAVCTWNTSFVPGGPWPAPVGTEEWPATSVDWCDALAYCKSVGKRLCGKVGGGSVPIEWSGLGDRDEWTRACSNGSTYQFPYGNTYDPAACNGNASDAGHPLPVGTFPGCKSAFGTFDQSGNISEWEDCCYTPDGGVGAPDDVCQARGGDYLSDWSYLLCNHGFGAKRDERRGTIGFRCCAD